MSKIVVIGDIILDEYLEGNATRLAPEGAFPIVNIVDKYDRVGGAGNVALNCHSFGAAVTLFVHTDPDDTVYSRIRSLLPDNRFVVKHISSGRTIPVKTRIVSHGKIISRYDNEITSYISSNECREVIQEIRAIRPDAVIVSDYAKGVVSQDLLDQLVTLSKTVGYKLFIDPKPSNRHLLNYCGAYLLTPNIYEARLLIPRSLDNSSPAELVVRLKNELELEVGLITLGEKGIIAIDRDDTYIYTSAHPVEVYDVTGAGDTVIAYLATSISSGSSLKDAVESANYYAGLSVKHFGTYNPSNLVINSKNDSTKLVSRERLIDLLAGVREQGSSVVMTNGCFDVLHQGHLHFLKECSQLGDYLVIAINSDNSIRRLKGNERPFFDSGHRKALLAELAYVDYIVEFEEDTPRELIELVRPDVLVKGSEYTPEKIVGAELANEVRTIELVEGYSSTRIIDRIKCILSRAYSNAQ